MYSFLHSFIHIEHLYSASSKNYSEALPTPARSNKAVILSSYLILSYLILSYLILSCLILSYLILSYLILSYLILSYLILSYLILERERVCVRRRSREAEI